MPRRPGKCNWQLYVGYLSVSDDAWQVHGGAPQTQEGATELTGAQAEELNQLALRMANMGFSSSQVPSCSFALLLNFPLLLRFLSFPAPPSPLIA